MTNKAQVIHKLGSPNAMKWQVWPVNYPGEGEVWRLGFVHSKPLDFGGI